MPSQGSGDTYAWCSCIGSFACVQLNSSTFSASVEREMTMYFFSGAVSHALFVFFGNTEWHDHCQGSFQPAHDEKRKRKISLQNTVLETRGCCEHICLRDPMSEETQPCLLSTIRIFPIAASVRHIPSTERRVLHRAISCSFVRSFVRPCVQSFPLADLVKRSTLPTDPRKPSDHRLFESRNSNLMSDLIN